MTKRISRELQHHGLAFTNALAVDGKLHVTNMTHCRHKTITNTMRYRAQSGGN
jgi:hypothetical protein